MATQYAFGKIVTNGLVLALDAADRNSYPGSGTTWNDLSGNNYSGSLTNGPTFNNTNGGNITFDGTNDFIQMVNTGSILTTNNFTIDIVCRPTSTITNVAESTAGFGALSGQRFVTEPHRGLGTDAGAGVSVGTNGIVVVEHAGDYIPALLSYTGAVSSTVFSHIVVTYTNKQPRAYLNTTLVKTGLTSDRSAVNLTIGLIGGMVYGYFAGETASVKYYNRTLSTNEILQNYNAQKSRFNL
jgi:uncharacterized spore protein YtfJ